jgi:hypothetical protein
MTEGDGSFGNPFACARTADNLFWRHHILALLTGAATSAWPLTARAQAAVHAGGRVSAQHDVRRLGSPLMAAFRQGLREGSLVSSPQARASEIFCELLGIHAFTRVICPPIPSPGFPRTPVSTPGVAAVEQPYIALPISTKSCYKEPVF